MDPDALVAAHRREWERLDALVRARRRSGADVDELVSRYRAATADLADIKTTVGRSAVGDRLSLTLSRARLVLTRAPRNPLRGVPAFFLRQLPAALYRIRWTTLAVAVAFVSIAALVGVWIAADPATVAALGDRADLRAYADEQFVSYYSENPAAVFAGTVWTNNAWVAAQCVAFGITGVWPVYIVVQNAVNLGAAAAIMTEFDRLDVFFAFILPHGLLELTCVFVAAAAGLHVFWAWIAPGRRGRGEALAAAGRSLGTVAVGLVFALALSGIVEAFVTPQPWPWGVKLALGAAALGVLLGYMLILGRRAFREGETGDLEEDEAGTPRLVAG
ncbi:stage II sporulation protein M [Microbacterium sp. SORGH_AS_0888]|uniref:stage II sporulation protein M n=1 Tax=Microbacterium sp. SORGH_AS_0888 TaxID=3041791 RepID=UPI002787DB5A|nr:stage II sporulation protein M [Microbacterium sp. SORGH_AS_0888]MDQ1127911.1 putative membrane protein SpoIIM required for sporulation [Microbacterium sp. SORGH_AS_0888]